MDIEEIIDKSVERTITKLNENQKKHEKSAAQKTIELLEGYKYFKLSDDPNTKNVVDRIENALKIIQPDPYYQIIPMRYFEKKSIWDISGFFDVSEKTIVRHRKALIRKLSCILCSDDVIREILS